MHKHTKELPQAASLRESASFPFVSITSIRLSNMNFSHHNFIKNMHYEETLNDKQIDKVTYFVVRIQLMSQITI